MDDKQNIHDVNNSFLNHFYEFVINIDMDQKPKEV